VVRARSFCQRFALKLGKGLEFSAEVAKVLWDGSVTGWNEGSYLSDAAARALTAGLKVFIFLSRSGIDLVRKRAADTTRVHPMIKIAAR
jgi:hypothetical protein